LAARLNLDNRLIKEEFLRSALYNRKLLAALFQLKKSPGINTLRAIFFLWQVIKMNNIFSSQAR